MTQDAKQDAVRPARTRVHWLRWLVIGIVGFVLALGLFARFVLPGILKDEGEKLLGEQLHRATTIGGIEIHPLWLNVAVHGVKVMEPAGDAVFASFETLEADISGQSLLHFAPVVKELRLATPYVHLVRTALGHYNFDDLAQASSKPETTPAANQQPARFSVYNIQISNGRVEFDDRPEKTVHTVTDLALKVPFISSLASQVEVFVEPALSARIDDAPFTLTGKALPFADPKEATLDANFDGLQLPRFIEYLPFEPRFKVPSAALDAHLSAHFQQPLGKKPTMVIGGTAALKDVRITEPDGAALISLPELSVTLGNLDVFGDKFEIAQVAVRNPEIHVAQESDGTLNLERLAPGPAAAGTARAPATNEPSAGASSSAPAAPTPAIEIAEMSIENGAVHYKDPYGPRPLEAGMEHFDLKVSSTRFDADKHELSIGEIASRSAAFNVAQGRGVPRGPARPPERKVASAVARAPSHPRDSTTSASSANALTVAVQQLTIADWKAHIEDRTLAKPVITDIHDVGLEVHGFSTAPGARARVSLAAGVNKAGHAAAEGEVGIAPTHADLAVNVKDLDLLPLQPYFSDQVNLLVTRGTVSTKGKLALDEAKDALRGGYAGDLTVAGLATVDRAASDEFLNWKSLYVGGIRLQVLPFSLDVGQVALTDFFARVTLDASGRINLQDIVRNDNADAGGGAAAGHGKPPAVASTATPSKSSSVPPIRIGRVTLQGGRVRFTDNFVKPNYSANLAELGGAVVGLSSDASSTASVDLRGKVNDAPLTIAGRINPLKGDLFLDLKANVDGMELVPFTPYSGKYLGYGIEKGKLSFDVAYKIDDRKLSAQNRLVLNQLTFGDKIESPTATSLPVRLAVSLLEDRNGVIDLDLPIGGSLDDPQFSIGGIIWHAIINVIEKAITAPFALLGSLFGADEKMSSLEFDAGRAALPPKAASQLAAMAKALNERPKLRLEIAGHVDAEADREGLRRSSIDRKVKAVKLKELVGRGESVDPDSVTVAAAEYPDLLRRAYKEEKFPKPRNVIGLPKDLPVEEMEKLMLANAQVSDSDLTQLAQQRAQAVARWLENDGKVAADRLFIVANLSAASAPASATATHAPESRVDFNLK